MLILRVIRGEGIPSAMQRAGERIAEAADDAVMRLRGRLRAPVETAVLNVSMGGISLRLGGLQSQLMARLELESLQRDVALYTPGLIQSYRPTRRHRCSLPEAMARTGARTIHLEGTFGVDIESILRMVDEGIDVIVSVHDYSLVCDDPHLLDAPISAARITTGRQLMNAAKTVVFPSRFFLEHHRQLLSLPLRDAVVIEPGVRPATMQRKNPGRAIAFAGSLKRHKGAHLLPDLIRACEGEWHIFGGGDAALLRSLPRTTIHGYYRAGTLPGLLARHDIGLIVLPSIWPEAYLLTLSEAWQAGVPAVAFDLGAVGERIREQGGGWVAPLESGTAGLAEIVRRWRAGELVTTVPTNVVTASDTANAYMKLYRTIAATPPTVPPPRS
jgi:glycosyltransferase involved in cell wall biosynthesis